MNLKAKHEEQRPESPGSGESQEGRAASNSEHYILLSRFPNPELPMIGTVGLAHAAVKFLGVGMEHQTDSGSVSEAGLEQGLYDNLSKLKIILRTHTEHWNDARQPCAELSNPHQCDEQAMYPAQILSCTKDS
ncbi:hypothetical protein B0H14DRAFT_2599095 [Mycena olivaceomarginata]|nr:hypothetical protein B0H14DRAFT_2599095 [Mycena olivaceomarginata]